MRPLDLFFFISCTDQSSDQERKKERKKRETLLREGRKEGRKEEALITRAVDFQHMWEAS